MSWFLSTIALIYQAFLLITNTGGVGLMEIFCQGGQEGGDKTVSSPTARPFTVLVEGNVGSGKSSFLDIMESWPGVTVFQEPVDVWRNVGGQNLFNDMISQPTRWTTTFQLFSTMTR